MKKLVFSFVLLLQAFNIANAEELFDAKNLQKLYIQTLNSPEKIVKRYEKKKEEIQKEKVNDLYIINSFYEKLQKSKYVDDFVFKIPQELDLFVMGSIRVIDNKYYIKQNPHWIKVMILTKPEFK